MSIDTLTDKQQRFVEEYLVDLNATQAAIRAGYSEKTANREGSRLLSNVDIAEAIAEAQAKRSKRTEVRQDRVLQEIARIAFSDLRKIVTDTGAIVEIHDWDDDMAAAVSSVEVVKQFNGEYDEDGKKVFDRVHKFKVWDKNSALEKLCRHLGMFTDKVELTGKDGGPVAVDTSDHALALKLFKLVKSGQMEIAREQAE